MKIVSLILRTLFAFALISTLTGCATSGQKFTEYKVSQKAPAEGEGRIYIYRTSAFGAAVQPPIMVNGVEVGKATPKAFYVVDRPAGTYEILTSTEVKRTLSLTLQPGQERYVRLNIAMGFWVGHVYPELIDTAQGEKEIKNCRYR